MNVLEEFEKWYIANIGNDFEKCLDSLTICIDKAHTKKVIDTDNINHITIVECKKILKSIELGIIDNYDSNYIKAFIKFLIKS